MTKITFTIEQALHRQGIGDNMTFAELRALKSGRDEFSLLKGAELDAAAAQAIAKPVNQLAILIDQQWEQIAQYDGNDVPLKPVRSAAVKRWVLRGFSLANAVSKVRADGHITEKMKQRSMMPR